MLSDTCVQVGRLENKDKGSTFKHHVALANGYTCYKWKFKDLTNAIKVKQAK